MARRSIDIRQFSGELRSHFAALLADARRRHTVAKDGAEQGEGVPSGVMACFDHALAKALLDVVSGPAPAPIHHTARKRRPAPKAQGKAGSKKSGSGTGTAAQPITTQAASA